MSIISDKTLLQHEYRQAKQFRKIILKKLKIPKATNLNVNSPNQAQ